MEKITFKTFFLKTFANFEGVENVPSGNPDYISVSGSEYWYVDEYVYRRADHWNANIATCSWFLNKDEFSSENGLKIGRCLLSDFKIKDSNFNLKSENIKINSKFSQLRKCLKTAKYNLNNVRENCGKRGKKFIDNFLKLSKGKNYLIIKGAMVCPYNFDSKRKSFFTLNLLKGNSSFEMSEIEKNLKTTKKVG